MSSEKKPFSIEAFRRRLREVVPEKLLVLDATHKRSEHQWAGDKTAPHGVAIRIFRPGLFQKKLVIEITTKNYTQVYRMRVKSGEALLAEKIKALLLDRFVCINQATGEVDGTLKTTFDL